MNLKPVLLAAVTAVAATSASALTILDSTDAGGGPFGLLADSYQFQDTFVDGLAGTTLSFDFVNDSATDFVVTISSATINQDPDNYFTDGAEVHWTGAGTVAAAAQGAPGGGLISFFLAAGASDTLNLTFGDVVAPDVLPDIDFTVRANLVPVPAGILLMGTALAGFGVMRRKSKKA